MRKAPEPQEGFAHLVEFGWAPGGYLIKCFDCLAFPAPGTSDKRAIRCRTCAEKAFAARRYQDAQKASAVERFNMLPWVF